MTLEEKYKKLLELVKKYDTFAEEIKNEYFSEIERLDSFVNRWKNKVIDDTKEEFKALREELKEIEND